MCKCGKKTQPSNYIDQSVYNNVDALKRSGVSNQVVVKEATQGEDFLDVIYNGPSTPHYIPTTTGVITSYGIKNYGMGKKGDRIRVHINDINSVNGKRLFTVIQGEEKMPEANEFLYAGNVSAEARSNERIKEAAEKAEKRSKSEARKATRAAEAAKEETVDEETQNDLVALSQEANADKNAEAVETNQADAQDVDRTDANQDNVPDEQQETAKSGKKKNTSDKTDQATTRVNWNS